DRKRGGARLVPRRRGDAGPGPAARRRRGGPPGPRRTGRPARRGAGPHPLPPNPGAGDRRPAPAPRRGPPPAQAPRPAEEPAAGGHHLWLIGPPGAGKTVIASRIPGILPPLGTDDALAVSAIHSVAGRFDALQGLRTQPPFENPHHTATPAAVVGG